MLHWQTVDPILLRSLHVLMKADEFMPFRLVGGTSLSLQLGHRISVDIDLFTDATYGTINFETIDHFLTLQFPYIDASFSVLPGMGRSYIIGHNENSILSCFADFTNADDDFEPICQRGKHWEIVKLDFIEAIENME